MNNKTVNRIIENYRPHEGFYDLSEMPKTLTRTEYAKVLNTQNVLAEQEKNKEYLMKFTCSQFQDWKECSALYQAIVYQYWVVGQLGLFKGVDYGSEQDNTRG